MIHNTYYGTYEVCPVYFSSYLQTNNKLNSLHSYNSLIMSIKCPYVCTMQLDKDVQYANNYAGGHSNSF